MAQTCQSSSKRKKLETKHDDQNGIDRLSNLPDAILIIILSFLPTETAVATSVLSKAWGSLWTLLQDLDFKESRNKTVSIDPYSSSSQRRDRRFENFVSKVLLHRRIWSIRRFSLEVDSSCCRSSDLDIWVSSAIARRVEELDLRFSDSVFVDSPVLAFPFSQQSCKNLRVLKLKSLFLGGRLGKICFPILKTLHLKRVRLNRRNASLVRFLSSRRFPVLEELVLVNKFDGYKEGSNLEISLHNLRSLYIAFRPEDEDGTSGTVYTLRIDCPALRHLDFNDHVFRELHLENLCNLVEADIDVSNVETECYVDYYHSVEEDDGDEFYGRYLMNLVKAMSNVRILTLSDLTMKEIQQASSFSFFCWEDIPIFHNLVRAELTLKGSAWNILMPLLHKFANLECLTLCTAYDRYVDEIEWIPPRNAPSCLTFHVTTVCFKEFRGLAYEMGVARYILGSSLVLKKVKFIFSSALRPKDECRTRNILSYKFPKGSEGCNLSMNNYCS